MTPYKDEMAAAVRRLRLEQGKLRTTIRLALESLQAGRTAQARRLLANASTPEAPTERVTT